MSPNDPASRTPVLLLLEDSLGEATLVREMLAERSRDRHQILQAPRLNRATECLRPVAIDAIVRHLHRPDGIGVETVHRVVRLAPEVPAVGLAGSDDADWALAGIGAGAQDGLPESEPRPDILRGAIGCALSRPRETQRRDGRVWADSQPGLGTTIRFTRCPAPDAPDAAPGGRP